MLSKQSLEKMCSGEKPLVSNMIDPEEQIQQNGIDFTLCKIEKIIGQGTIDFDNSHRELSRTEELNFGQDDFITLEKGVYKVTFNEVVNMPLNIMAIAKTRSSLMRCGIETETGLWDAGYNGRSQCLLIVHNFQGIRFGRNAKLIQLAFAYLDEETREGYNGVYQGENLKI